MLHLCSHALFKDMWSVQQRLNDLKISFLEDFAVVFLINALGIRKLMSVCPFLRSTQKPRRNAVYLVCAVLYSQTNLKFLAAFLYIFFQSLFIFFGAMCVQFASYSLA